MRRELLAIIVGTVCAIGCHSDRAEPSHAVAPDETALRIRVARDEALRAGGVADLVGLSRAGELLARELALRGLGRIGSPDALAVVDAALGDRDPAIVSAALAARGIAAMLDDDPLAAPDATARGAKLVQAMQRCGSACDLAGIEALGRAGSVGEEPRLVELLATPRTAPASAIAFGTYKRRKLEWTEGVEAALARASTTRALDELRYAAVWALATGHAASEHAQAGLATSFTIDALPEISAAAIKGLVFDGAERGTAEALLERALDNPDWRVQVEAVRALAGKQANNRTGPALAARLRELVERALARDGVATQVAAVALRAIAERPEPAFATDLAAIANTLASPRAQPLSPISRGWLRALAARAVGSATGQSTALSASDPDLPDRLRLGLAAELAAHDPIDRQRALVHALLGDRDPAVRRLAFALFAALWPSSDPPERQQITGAMSDAIARGDLAFAGAAADAVGDLYGAMGSNAPERAPLDAAVLARAAGERDPELAGELVELLGKAHVAGAAEACRAHLAGPPIVAVAAAHCLQALGEHVVPPAIGAATPPPVDVAAVIGHRVRWHLETTRGNIDIELLPDVAPWNVATIAALTTRHFYDGTEIHRVVPDFVVQGGDPTASGAGGPGFTTPAEPASMLDGAGFVRGAVGMADAGRDSAGSQWFITHTRTPHLDGRYTWVGQVVSGQDVADSLLIGDRVLRATIEIVRK